MYLLSALWIVNCLSFLHGVLPYPAFFYEFNLWPPCLKHYIQRQLRDRKHILRIQAFCRHKDFFKHFLYFAGLAYFSYPAKAFFIPCGHYFVMRDFFVLVGVLQYPGVFVYTRNFFASDASVQASLRSQILFFSPDFPIISLYPAGSACPDDSIL